VQPDVDEVGGDLERRRAAGELVEAERDVALRQQLEQRGREPGRVAELEGVAVRRRQRVEKAFDPSSTVRRGLGSISAAK